MKNFKSRPAQRYKGIFGEIKQVSIPIAIIDEVQALVNEYKKKRIALADENENFNIKDFADSLRNAKKHSELGELLKKRRREELLKVLEFMGMEFDKHYRKRGELEMMIFDREWEKMTIRKEDLVLNKRGKNVL